MRALRLSYAVEVAAAQRDGQDRARVIEAGDDLIVALADGAGGTGNGATAAQAIVDAVGADSAADDWCVLLDDLDCDTQRLGNDQSTAVIVSIRGGVLSGASVGDSVPGCYKEPMWSSSLKASSASRWLATAARRGGFRRRD